MTPDPDHTIRRLGGPAGPSRVSRACAQVWAGRAVNFAEMGLRFSRGQGRRCNDNKCLGGKYGPDGPHGPEKSACPRARILTGSGGIASYAKGKFSSPICPSSPKKEHNHLKTNKYGNEK